MQARLRTEQLTYTYRGAKVNIQTYTSYSDVDIDFNLCIIMV